MAAPGLQVRQVNQRTDVLEGVLLPFWYSLDGRLDLVTQMEHKDYVKIAKVFTYA